MMATRTFEWLDRRALAALRFVDAVSGVPVEGRIALAAAGVSVVRKRSGDIVVLAAPGLEEHRSSFLAPPATPAIGTVPVAIDARPLSPAYAARRFALRLPRDPDPDNRDDPDSLFNAAIVELLPSPAYQASGQAAALRVTVRRTDDQRRVGGALVRLRPAGGLLPARAMTDATGEALLVVRGVPLASPGPGATTVADIAAEVDVLVDPALASFVADDALDAARAAALAQSAGFIDPDDLETRLGGAAPPALAVRLRSGATGTVALDWSPP
jgi:hypothetical protein